MGSCSLLPSQLWWDNVLLPLAMVVCIAKSIKLQPPFQWNASTYAVNVRIVSIERAMPTFWFKKLKAFCLYLCLQIIKLKVGSFVWNKKNYLFFNFQLYALRFAISKNLWVFLVSFLPFFLWLFLNFRKRLRTAHVDLSPSDRTHVAESTSFGASHAKSQKCKITRTATNMSGFGGPATLCFASPHEDFLRCVLLKTGGTAISFLHSLVYSFIPAESFASPFARWPVKRQGPDNLRTGGKKNSLGSWGTALSCL